MRITEAARRLGTSARMLRYREDLGLLPQVRDRSGGPVTGGPHGPSHRQFSEEDLEAVAVALALQRRYGISPASLAFGLRVLAEPAVARRWPISGAGSAASPPRPAGPGLREGARAAVAVRPLITRAAVGLNWRTLTV